MDKIEELKLEIKVLRDKVKELENELAKRPTKEELEQRIKDVCNWATSMFPTC